MYKRGTFPEGLSKYRTEEGVDLKALDFCDNLTRMTEEQCDKHPILSNVEKVFMHFYTVNPYGSFTGTFEIPANFESLNKEKVPTVANQCSVQGKGDGLYHISLPSVRIQMLLLFIRDGIMVSKTEEGVVEYSLTCAAGVNARAIKVSSLKAPLEGYLKGDVPSTEETISGLITSAGNTSPAKQNSDPSDVTMPLLYGTVTDTSGGSSDLTIDFQHASKLAVADLKTFLEAIVSKLSSILNMSRFRFDYSTNYSFDPSQDLRTLPDD
mgnify:CR=1 FL=1